MDKDSKLIFESYKNRVVLGEAAPALAIPAAGIGVAQVLGLAATAVGATALASQIAQKEDQLSKMFTLTSSTESVVEKVGSIIQSNDTSVRGLYGALNYAKSLNIPVLNDLIQKNLNDLSMFNALQDGSLDAQQSIEYIDSILFTIKESNKELLDLAIKTTNEQLIKVIREQNKRTDALVNRLLDERNQIQKGGGGGGPDKDPNKKSKIWQILKAIYNNIATAKFWIVVGILTIAVLILAGVVVGAEAVGSALGAGARGAVEGAVEAGKGFVKGASGKTNETPQIPPSDSGSGGKWLPKPKSPTSSPEAAPTPFPIKRRS